MAKFGPERDGQSFQLQFPKDAVGLDPDAFDKLIHDQGVQFTHWRSFRCPIGLVDPDDVRRPHEHHANCSGGFLHVRAGNVTAAFLGNSSDYRFADPGRIDSSTVSVVLPRFYDDKPEERLDVASFDKFYLVESDNPVLVSTWHTFSAHITGVDRLMFPAVKVTDLIDAYGNSYQQDVDFEVVNGQLHWGNRRPGIDPKSGKGVVCSVRFNYTPHWFVKNLPHEVRLAQTEDEFGNRSVQRMPVQAVLQREIFFFKEANDPQASSPEVRQKPSPPDGQFGPR